MNADVNKALYDIKSGGKWIIDKTTSGESGKTFIGTNEDLKVFIKHLKASPALIRLSHIGVAPRVIYDGSNLVDPFFIQNYVELTAPTPSWFIDNIDLLAKFVATYHNDNQLKAILKNKANTEYSEFIQNEISYLNERLNESSSKRYIDCKDSIDILLNSIGKLPKIDLVPTHTDPNPQNIQLSGNKLLMIDWDDISLSDPYKDIGLILWWYIPRDKWQDFFTRYGMSLDVDRIYTWIAKSTLLISLWSEKSGNNEYADFFVDDFVNAQNKENNSLIYTKN